MHRSIRAGLCALALMSPPLLAQAPDGTKATEDFARQFQPFGLDLGARDTALKPGDDFGKYASGTWARQAAIPADQPMAGVFYDEFNLSQIQLRSLIETAAPTTRIGAMYASFMDEAHVDALGGRPLAPDLARIAAAPDRTALARIDGGTMLGFGLPILSLDIDSDFTHAGMNVLFMSQAGIGLPNRDYYLKAEFKPQLAAYRAYVERALAMADYPNPAASADAIVAFETRIAQASWPEADRRDFSRINNPMTVAELAAWAPGFPWQAYFDGAEVPQPGTIVVQEKSAIKAIADIYATTPLDTLKAWSSFHLVHQASPYLAKAFVDSRFDYLRTLTGVTAQRPRWKRGAGLLDTTMGEELGHLYTDRFFPPSSKAQMERLVANLKTAMADRIRNAGWMSADTKTQALAKLDRMQVLVGYPDKWRDYSALRVDPADLYGNVQRSSAFEWRYKIADLGKPVDPRKWGITPQTVNAYNGGTQNRIIFPAAILQPPFFNASADPAVNYGAIGAVIGHEITHGFDDQGRKIDETGKLRDWWAPQDSKRFDEQAALYGKQFDSYEPLPGAHVNGTLTMGENIADLGGLLVAYDAYHRSLGGKPAPVLGGLTGDQRFFLSWAQLWRSKVREETMRQLLTVDPHSPDSVRQYAPMRDIDAWYAAFGIKPGDALYVPPEQRVRIW